MTTMNPRMHQFNAAVNRVSTQTGIPPANIKNILAQMVMARMMSRQAANGGMGGFGGPSGSPMGMGTGMGANGMGMPSHGMGMGPSGMNGMGMGMARPQLTPQHRAALRHLLRNDPNVRSMVRDMVRSGQFGGPQQNGLVQNGSQHHQGTGQQKNVNQQDGLININNQININNCGCDHKSQSNTNIKGDEKGGWLAKHGGYKKNKDGSFDITKGKWKGHKAIPNGKGKYNIQDSNGKSVGQYSSPKGKDKIASPLAFDLNGDGKVGTTGVQDGKKFDINGDGKVDQTAWAGKGDGVLAFDANKDGVAGSDGKELLGNNTDVDGDGKADGHANGFEALKALATKNLGAEAVADGKLDQRELQALEQKTGLTMNVDGKNRSLGELGISEVNLGYTEAGANPDENGNEHRQVGAGFVRNGEKGKVNDVWFKYQ